MDTFPFVNRRSLVRSVATVLWLLLLPYVAQAQGWATWTAGSATSASFSLPGGPTGTVTLVRTACGNAATTLIGAPISYSPGTPTNYTQAWYTPPPPAPAQWLPVNSDTQACAGNAVTGTLTFTFNAAVTDPVFHFMNLDAAELRFLDGVSITRLSGNNELEVVGTSVNVPPVQASQGGCEANAGTNPEGGCGSVRVNGTFTQVRYEMTDVVEGAGGGDGHVLSLSLPPQPAFNSCTPDQLRATQRYWFFGDQAGLDFGASGTQSPTALVGADVTYEGSTVVTDTQGQLQFWSNAGTVYNRNNQPMLNGTGLQGEPSATQTVASFPAMGRSGVYFVVTTGSSHVASQLRYSEVDMSLDGGLGGVVPGRKNLALGGTTAFEAINAIPNADGTGFWVLTSTAASPNFLAYAFDGNGPVSQTPVITALPNTNAGLSGYHRIQISPDGTRLLFLSSPNPGQARLYLLDFNAATGRVFPVVSWLTASGLGYGADFSPSGRYVYATSSSGGLYRYDIVANTTQTAIQNNAAVITTATNFGQIKRAPDGKMYLAEYPATTLNVIHAPEAASAANVQYQADAFPLATNTSSWYGLPEMVTGCPLPTATDLAVTKTDNSATYTPGANVVYTIVVTNNGPLPATAAQISDPLPAGITTASWTCAAAGGGACGAASGSGAIATTANLPVSATVTYTMTLATPSTLTGPLTNEVTVTPVGGDTVPTNNVAQDIDTPAAVADLAITKVSTPKPYVPGQPLTYTVVVSNLGPSIANGALINDTLPATLSGITWTCSGNGGGSCPVSGSGSLVNVPVNLPVGGSTTFLITATTPSGPIVTLTNIATVAPPSGTTDPVMGNNVAQDLNPAGPEADLRITKVSSPNPYVPGQALIYTIVVTNAGPSDAPGARVLDTWPAPFASFTWTCAPNGGGAACVTASGSGNIDALVNLPAGSSATFTGTGAVPSNLTGQITNTATITEPATVTDPVQGNNRAQDVNPSDAQVDLAITKAQSPDPYVPGQPLTYTIVVSNNGPSDAPNARVQDTPPSSLTNVTWTCAPSGAGATCATPSGNNIIDALVTLPVDTSATFTVTANVATSQTGVLTNTATVAAPTGVSETIQGNNSATVNSGPAPQADLGIVKTAAPEPYRPGTAVTYTISVTNAGPSDVVGARVQDTFPGPMSGFTWTCSGAGGATCGAASGVSVIDTLVNVPVGGVITFSASGVVPVSTTTAVTNIATVSPPAGTNDSNGTNNSSLAPSTPIYADLALTKVSVTNPVRAAEPMVYTLTVSNAGAFAATNVTVSDQLPAGTTFTSASGSGWTCALNGTAIACTTPSVAVGQAPPITVTLRAPNEPGVVTNTATVGGSEVDPNPSNNPSTTTTTVTPVADLAITKVSAPYPYVPGTPFGYTIIVSNLGPSTALGAQVSDTLPADLAGFTWTCTPNNASAQCGTASGSAPTVDPVVNLAPGGSVTILVTGTLPSSTTGVLTNTASVIPPAAVPDPVPGNNDATDPNPAEFVSDLRISKASTPNPFVPGQTLTYTIVATNAGPSDVIGAQVQDTLPAAFAAFTWTCTPGPGAACATDTGTGDIDVLVNVPAGGTVTFTSTGTVPSGYTSTATNSASIKTPPNTKDPIPGNNTTTVPNPPNIIADLMITKTQTPEPYVPGTGISYTLLVQNLGPSDAVHARVQDLLPGVITGATWTCAPSGAGASCAATNGVTVVDALVTLPVGTSAIFAVNGTVSPSATGVLSNTATVSAPANVTDPVPGNNESTVNSGGAPQAELAIVKTASVNPYVPGAPLSFTIVASNNGPSDAPNARVQDLFPAALSGFTWTCAPSAGAATCGAASGLSLIDVLVNLPVGGAVTFTVSGTVPPDTIGPLTNTATVAPPIGVNDPNHANNLSAVTLGANALADLSVTKTSSPNPYVPGSPITYTIVASNAGPSVLFGGRVRDGAPAVLQNLTWTCSAVDATCPASSGVGNIDALVDIAPGGTVTFSLTGDVAGGTRGTLVNAATIVPPPGTEDPAPTNNTGTNYNPSIPIPGPADLQITQEFPGVAPPNGLLTFRLRTRNLGSNTALNPYMTGLIPPGTTFVSVTPSAGGMCNTPGNPPAPDPVTGYPMAGAATEPLRCTWPGLMKPGESHFMEFTVRVAPGTPTGQILWSCWWTWSETEDPYHANNVVDAYLFVHDGTSPVGDLSIQAAAAVVSGSGASADQSALETYEAIGNELPVPVGGTVKMRFWATNAGPAATRGQYALILDEVAISVVDVTLPQGWVSPSGPSSAVWDTGQIQPGQTVNLDLTVRLNTTGAIKLFAQRITGSPGDPNASNEHAEIVLDGYGPNATGRWVAVGDVDGAGQGEILTGTGQGETPQVRVYTGTGADTGVRFFAYERPFLGGVRIASCDVNGDGIDELITAPGPGRASTIRALSLVGGVVTELIAFDAFEPGFTGGASIACADLDSDGSAEVIVGAGPGRAPEVQVYSVGLSSITPRATFLAYEAGFLGGVRVAAGVYAGRPGWLDAFAIATTPGIGRAAELRLWTPTGGPVAQVVVSSATKGVLPTLGDVNGDGQIDLLLAPDDGRPELVRIFEVDTGQVLGDVEGGLPAFPVGIRTAIGVLEGGPGQPEIVIGNGPGGHPRVRVIYWPPAGPVQRLEILPLEIP